MSAEIPPFPDFRSKAFLEEHIQSTLDFYLPGCIDGTGGFFHHFRDDGSVYDHDTRHLVSSTRFVFNFARCAAYFKRDDYLELARHGLKFIAEAHLNPKTGGYAWLLNGRKPLDDTNHCYGFAFVLLAYAVALQAGCSEARAGLFQVFNTMERYFWDEPYGLYRDEMSGDWQHLAPYRGQNANMHCCEALLAAYKATKDELFLTRADTLAHNMTVRQAGLANGRIWEHYTPEWQLDWEYNKEDPKHRFRPWGFQPGHQTEWAKLLLLLDAQKPAAWRLPRASDLFDRTLATSWDAHYGGICYSLHPQNGVSDDDKYHWVQVETAAAAALLAQRTGQPLYWDWYERLWGYCWQHFIDHRYGAWFRILTRDNQKYSDHKSPAGKTDYHTLGACFDIIEALYGIVD